MHIEEKDSSSLADLFDHDHIDVKVYEDENGNVSTKSTFWKSHKCLFEEYSLSIFAHAFDFVMVMLMRACGEHSASMCWWPPKDVMDLWDTHAHEWCKPLPVLWPREKERLAAYQREGRYRSSPTMTPAG